MSLSIKGSSAYSYQSLVAGAVIKMATPGGGTAVGTIDMIKWNAAVGGKIADIRMNTTDGLTYRGWWRTGVFLPMAYETEESKNVWANPEPKAEADLSQIAVDLAALKEKEPPLPEELTGKYAQMTESAAITPGSAVKLLYAHMMTKPLGQMWSFSDPINLPDEPKLPLKESVLNEVGGLSKKLQLLLATASPSDIDQVVGGVVGSKHAVDVDGRVLTISITVEVTE